MVRFMLPNYKTKMNQNDIDKFNQIKIVEIKENKKHNFYKWPKRTSRTRLDFSSKAKVYGLKEMNLIFF